MWIASIGPFERSRLRGGRFACNTPGVTHYRTQIAIELVVVGLTPSYMIKIP